MFLAAWLLAYATYATAGGRSGPIAYKALVAADGLAPVALHVEELGNGPPVLLLHGIGGSGYSFREIVGPLSRRHRVITIDLKGFGASEKPFDDAYGAGDQARLVLAFIAQRGLGRVDIVGHSFGGTIALVAALAEARRGGGHINRLVLLGAPAYPQPIRRGLQFLTLPVLPYVALTLVPPILTARSALEPVLPSVRAPSERDAIAYAEPLYEAGGRHALIATTRGIAAYQASGAVPDYRRLRNPSLLVWCRRDPTVPFETGERLARDLARAQLVALEGCEHSPAEEQPTATAQMILRFLAVIR